MALFNAHPERTARLIRLASLLVLALSMAAALLFLVHQREDSFYAVAADRSPQALLVLDRPNLTDTALLNWAVGAVTETMTFGFNNMTQRMTAARRHFTAPGWEGFQIALGGQLRSAVLENFQIVTAAVRAPATIPGRVPEGRRSWSVQVPILLTFQAGTKSDSRRSLVTLTVVEVPTSESPFGVGIEQWLME